MKKNTKASEVPTLPLANKFRSSESLSKDTKIVESQKNMIINYLFAGNRITALDALSMFNCFSLAQRIHNLRMEGCDIITEMINTGKGKIIARYSLKKFQTEK
jgi:hypothetical protein